MLRLVQDPVATEITMDVIRHLVAGPDSEVPTTRGVFEIHTSTSPIRDEP
ncbi:hypothetical protein G5V59_00355 [Nocardioides sp. W3-2-3]|nr:hypothetical protein [Nocardioides convexus]NGZ99422.1 hypothetical protein [Nocardioides convexus]